MCDKHICLRIGWNNWSFIIVKAKICRSFVVCVCVCVLFYKSKVFIKAFLLLHFILTFFWCLNTCMPSVCKYTFGPSEAAFSLRGDRMSCPLCRCMDTIGILPQTHLNYTHTHTHSHWGWKSHYIIISRLGEGAMSTLTTRRCWVITSLEVAWSRQ